MTEYERYRDRSGETDRAREEKIMHSVNPWMAWDGTGNRRRGDQRGTGPGSMDRRDPPSGERRDYGPDRWNNPEGDAGPWEPLLK